MKTKTIRLLFFIAVALLFRGWFYRHLVTYKSIGQRVGFKSTNPKLITYINVESKNQIIPDIDQIIKLSLLLTSRQLNFTTGHNDIDPNRLIDSKTAHCVGYASFFATSCNYLLKKYNLADNWAVSPQIGQLYFIGINIHPYFDSAFFRDHDFVLIKNKITGQTFAVDPTVNDYLDIDFVTYNET